MSKEIDAHRQFRKEVWRAAGAFAFLENRSISEIPHPAGDNTFCSLSELKEASRDGFLDALASMVRAGSANG